MKRIYSFLLCTVACTCFATTPDIRGVKQVIDESSVIAVARISAKEKQSDGCDAGLWHYRAFVDAWYKVFGIAEREISFCSDVSLQIEKSYAVALYCERNKSSGYPLSASVDSIFYETENKRFRRKMPQELLELIPVGSDPALESADLEEILSGRMIQETKSINCSPLDKSL